MLISFSKFQLWYGCIALVSVLVAVALFYYGRMKENRRIIRVISKLGVRVLSSIKLPDGIDGDLYIDFLLLTSKGITAIAVKRYEGFIYAGDKLEQWTQVVNGSNYLFPNPLHEMKLKISVLKSLLPDIEIQGKILFAGNCCFPKGKPEAVMLLGDITNGIDKEPISEHYYASWEKLYQYQSR